MPPEEIAARFRAALGTLEGLEFLKREHRWVAVGREVIAFASLDEAGWRRLHVEASLLERWGAGGLPVPRVEAIATAERVQVRQKLLGLTGAPVEPKLFGVEPTTVDRYAPAAPLTHFGEVLAGSYGRLTAQLHTLTAAEGAALGLTPRPHLDLEDTERRLCAAMADKGTALATFTRLKDWLGQSPPADAVVHGDLHFHNLCLDDTGAITGLFDLDEAGLASRWTDLQFLHSYGPRFVHLALAAYAAERGLPCDEESVWRAHLWTALEHLRWHPPGTPRHPSICRWIDTALHAHR